MEIVQLIDLLDKLTWVFLACCILFIVLAIATFILFKIPQLFAVKSGKAQRATIDKMKQLNANTGRLSAQPTGLTGVFGDSQELQYTTEISQNNQQATVNETAVLSGSVINSAVAQEYSSSFVIVKEICETHMLTGLLPVGTVVLLKESTKRLIIIGVLQKQYSDGRIWDYVGCFYPEGFISAEKNFLFDTEQIDRIFALGYQDEEQFEFKEKADEKLLEIRADALTM